MKMNNPDKTISTEDCVDEFLLNKLTTIGHSQGAIYCYLYGNIGKEIIKSNKIILKIIYEKLFPNIFLLRYGKKIIFKTKEKKFIKRYIYATPSKL